MKVKKSHQVAPQTEPNSNNFRVAVLVNDARNHWLVIVRVTFELKMFHIYLSGHLDKNIDLTISEHSGRRDLHGIDDADVVQNRDAVAVNLSIMDEGANVNAFGWVANARADGDCDVFSVAAIQRLIQVVC